MPSAEPEELVTKLKTALGAAHRVALLGDRIHVDDRDGRNICTVNPWDVKVWVTCTVHHEMDAPEQEVLAKMAELVGVLEARGYGQEMLPSSGTGDALEEALCREVDAERLADEVRWISGQTFEVSI